MSGRSRSDRSDCPNEGDSVIRSTRLMDADALRDLILASLDDDKAEDIAVIDLSGKCDFADYMLVASGRSQRHVSSIAVKLAERLKQAEHPPLSVEGMQGGEWVLIDAGDIIVHVFHPEKREFYNIEKMWEVPMPVLVSSQSGMTV